jgi:hypothetical protein
VSTEDSSRKYGGFIKEDGTYTVPMITAGPYKVLVETNSMKPQGSARGGYAGNTGGGPQQEPKEPDKPLDKSIKEKVPEGYRPSNPADARANQNAARYVEVPAAYGNAETTKLTYTAVAGEQTHDLNLE